MGSLTPSLLNTVSTMVTSLDVDNVQTDTGVNDTCLLRAYDVDGAAWVTFITLTAANTPTCILDGVAIGTNTVATICKVDNISIDANTISTLNTNGDLNLSPNGTGTVVINTDLDVDNININGNSIISTNVDGNISITPNGTGEVDLSKVDIDSGTIDGATIATSNITVGATKTLDVSAGTLTLANDQISGDKVEGGTIAATTITTLTSTTVLGTTFDTNVTAAGVTLAGTTLAADGTDANIDITITPKGTGSVVQSKVDINGGTIDGATIATSNVTVGAGKTLDVSAGTLTLAADQISGDKVEGGTIAAITITALTLGGDPTLSNHAANKNYVDALIAGLDFKDTCYATTTATLNATYVNGVAGVGATLTNAGALAAFSVDGQSPAINSRILVKNQSTAAQNGIYTLTTVGSGAVAWILTRSTGYDQAAEIGTGDVIPVEYGTVNATTSWLQTATVTTVGTDSLSFTQFTYGPTTFCQVANNLSDVASATTSRTNLGVGTGDSPAFTSVVLNNANGVQIKDSDASHNLSITTGSNLTAARTLTFNPGDASRTATINGDFTITGTNTGDQTITLTGGVTGSGTGSFAATVVGGGVLWTEVTGTSQSIAVANGYIANNAGLVTLTLPTTAAVGDVMKVVGKGAGGWRVAQNASQTIHLNSTDTTAGVGGRLDSTNRYNAVTLICTTANTDFVVLNASGDITVT